MLRLDVDTQRAAEYLIRNLEVFEQNKILRPALKSAAEVFAAKGRMNLAARVGRGTRWPSRSKGILLRSITTSTRASRRKGRSAMAVAGFRREVGGIDGWYANFVDLGTQPRYTKDRNGKKDKYRGIMPANKFWTDARESEEGKATEILYNAIARAVERINSRR